MSNAFSEISEISKCSVIHGPLSQNLGRSKGPQVAQRIDFLKIRFWGGSPGRSECRFPNFGRFRFLGYVCFSEISENSRCSLLLGPLSRNPGRSAEIWVAQTVDFPKFSNKICFGEVSRVAQRVDFPKFRKFLFLCYFIFSEILEIPRFSLIPRPLSRNPGRSAEIRVAQRVPGSL